MDTPAFTLTTQRLGALPLIGCFAARMGLPRLLDTWVPADDARLALDPAVVIAVMIANLAVEHRPLYALGEWAAACEPALPGLAGRYLELTVEVRCARSAATT